MWQELRTYLIAGAVAMLIWLYAEANTLQTDMKSVRIQFVGPPDTLFIENANVTVDLTYRCARGQVEAVRRLEQPFRLNIGEDLDSEQFERIIFLDGALLAYEPLANLGVTIKQVSLETFTIRVHRLKTITLPIGVAQQERFKSIQFEPDQAQVTVTAHMAALAEEEGMGLEADLSDEFLSQFEPDVAQNQSVTFTLPDALRDVQPANFTPSIEPGITTAQFAIKDVNSTYTPLDVPVKILLPADMIGKYEVVLSDEDKSQHEIVLSGPREQIDKIRNNEGLIRVYVELSYEHLDKSEYTTTLKIDIDLPHIRVVTGPKPVTIHIRQLDEPSP